jgi:hypothetical protein
MKTLETKTMFDIGSLIEELTELRDEHDADDLSVYCAHKDLITSVELREDDAGNKSVVLR